MPAALRIFPEAALPMWNAHPWHQDIADFALPDKALLSLRSAFVSASCFLGPERAGGGVYDSRGDYVPASRHLRRVRDLTASNPPSKRFSGDLPRLSGRYLYLGWFFNHYGHFILESLGRAWALQECGEIDGYIMHLHAANGSPAPYLLEFFDLLAIPRDKVIFADQDLAVEELLLPSQQAVLSRGISKETLALYRQLGERAAREKENAFGSKLYVSRRFLPPDQRGASNEKALEVRFEAQGYKVVHPQFMNVKAQLAMFSDARKLAGLEGSGLHNVLFAREPEVVWMLGSRNHLADAITQAELDKYRDCETELHLQDAPEFSCLHPRITPFVIDVQEDEKDVCLSGLKAAPYDRFRWLSTLAMQLQRKKCLHGEGSAHLTSEEKSLLDGLPVSPDGEMVKADALSTDQELADFLSVEQHFIKEDYASAVEQMAAYLDKYDNHAAFLQRYAELLTKAQRHKEALKIAGRAEQLDPDNPALALLIARLLVALDRKPAAIEELEDLIRAFPRCHAAGILLAEVLAQTDRFREAADLLGAVISDSPNQKGMLARLTWYLFRCGDHEAAREAAHAALEHMPANPFSFAHLARIHLALNEPEVAMTWVERAIERSPGKQELRQLRSRIVSRLDQS